MKKMATKLTSFALLTFIILTSFVLTSCNIFSPYYPSDFDYEEPQTEPDTNSGSSAQGGTSSGNTSGESTSEGVIGGESTEASPQSGFAYATAKGLRSTVSVYCGFEDSSSKTYYMTGSGVIYKADAQGNGYIITNYHVVYDSDSTSPSCISEDISVYLYGRETFHLTDDMYAIEAKCIGGSANYDIAILEVKQSDILSRAIKDGSAAAVTVGDSNAIVPGDTTIAIGNPTTDGVKGISATSGIVSVVSEYITLQVTNESGSVQLRVIRTDTPVNGGNSGGGLYNEQGELIGIVNAKSAISNIDNIGYAIPSSIARGVADNVIYYHADGELTGVTRTSLGITITAIEYSTKYDSVSGYLYPEEVVQIYELSDTGYAKNLFQVGDIIKSVTIGGKTTVITRQHHMIDALLDARVGKQITITVERDGKTLSVPFTLTQDSVMDY